jgi:hypothetical protein
MYPHQKVQSKVPYVIYEKLAERYCFPLCSFHALRSEECDTGKLCADIALYFVSIYCRLFKSLCHLCVPTNRIRVFTNVSILELKSVMKFSDLPTPSQQILLYKSEMPKAGKFVD